MCKTGFMTNPKHRRGLGPYCLRHMIKAEEARLQATGQPTGGWCVFGGRSDCTASFRCPMLFPTNVPERNSQVRNIPETDVQ